MELQEVSVDPPSLICSSEAIPEEVLEHILFLATHGGKTENHDPFAVLPLSHVNQLWRATAISAPRLWRDLGKVIVKKIHMMPVKEALLLERLRTFFRRSEPYPITFSFNARWHGWEGDPNIQPPSSRILAQLCEFSSRWENVTLQMRATLIPILKGITGIVPVLQKLSIAVCCTPLENPLTISHFSDAPKLRSFELTFKCHDNLTGFSTQMTLPWSQLESYTESIQGLPASPGECSNLSEVMIHSTALRSLKCAVGSLHRAGWQQERPIQRESLTQLSLQFITSDAIPLLQHLVLPSLTKLSIYASDPLLLLRSTNVLVVQSACTLLSLAILCHHGGWEEAEGDFLTLLKRCPDLEKLHINHVHTSIFRRMGGAGPSEGGVSSGPILLPSLRKLYIHSNNIETTPNLKALNELGRARETTAQSGTTPRLMLRLSTSGLTHHSIIHIQAGLDEVDNVAIDKVDVLWKWCSVIRDAERRRERYRKLHKLFEVNRVIKEIEKYEINATTVPVLYAVGFPAFLHEFLLSAEPTQPERGSWLAKHNLKLNDRARAVLDKWKPALIEDTRTNRKWARCTSLCINYTDNQGKEGWKDDADVWGIVVSATTKYPEACFSR